MPAARYNSYVGRLQAQLAKEPGLDSHFPSCPRGCSANGAEIKEAEVCFSTARALGRDFQGQSGEKGPLGKHK